MVPIEVVATTEPFAFTDRSELARPVMAKLDDVPAPRIALPLKILLPEKVLLSERSVEDAALIVMLLEPLNDTPLMVRAVCSVVAVPAFPVIDPLTGLLKITLPEKVSLSERMVEEAAEIVIDPPRLNELPLMVPRTPVM